MKTLTFCLIVVFSVVFAQNQKSQEYREKNAKFVESVLSAIITDEPRIVVNDQEKTAVLNSFKETTNRTYTEAEKIIADLKKFAAHTIPLTLRASTLFEREINRTNTKYPKCSSSLDENQQLAKNYTESVNQCVDVYSGTVYENARLKQNAVVLQILYKAIMEGTEMYSTCLTKPDTCKNNAVDQCVAKGSQIQNLSPKSIRTAHGVALHVNIGLSMRRANAAAKACIISIQSRFARSLHELRRKRVKCIVAK